MKKAQMQNDICKFYENKRRIFYVSIGRILLLFGSYLAAQSDNPREKLAGYAGLVFFGVCMITGISKILSNKAFIEITPTYIKMYNFEKLLWTDITGVQDVQISHTKFIYFDVKDTSKYRLTFWQKVNQKCGQSPFYISLVTLPEKDLNKLQQIIKQHVPECSVEVNE